MYAILPCVELQQYKKGGSKRTLNFDTSHEKIANIRVGERNYSENIHVIVKMISRRQSCRDVYKYLRTMDLEGKRDRRSAYINDEDDVLLRDVELIRKQWVR